MADIMVIARLVGMALGCVIVMQFTWAIVRLFINSPDRSIVQHIAATLLNALRSGEPPDWALHGLQCQLRWPYPQRIRRCLKLLNHNEPLPLGQALITSKLFPVSESGHAAAATAGGQPLLLRWLADLAGAPPSRSGNITATYPLLLLPMAAIFSFMMTVIAPKYEMIFKDIGAPLPAFSKIVFFGSRLIGNYWPILMPFFIVAMVGLLCLLSHWHWRRRQHEALAGLLLAGSSSGRSEVELAAALTSCLPARHSSLTRAGNAGDFAALCRAGGWHCDTPEALSLALSHYLTLQVRRRAVLTGIIQILVPILMGTFVALLVLAFFLPLIHLIRLLSGDAP